MPTPSSIDGLLEKASKYLTKEQVNRIQTAYEFGALAHQGQTRKSGEDYIWHPVAVAEVLADIQLDQESLIAAILHDVVEDTKYTKEDIAERFGESVSEIVEGVTKLGKLEFENPQEAQAENFRKMILAMARDIRVILIKLADRLHNMRTLGVMRPAKQRRIAHETLDIFAPIAGRLGINAIRIELEDLGFKAMYPVRYAVLENAVRKARGNRNELIDQITDTIQNRLNQEGIEGKVVGREKHLYSLYKKMRNKRQNFNDILDIFAFRIIVSSADQCYRTLGSIHSLYKPLPGRFKDYIAIPKSNGYQSLHTSLFGPFGMHLEVQIRNSTMHEVSEHGIAAHWQYKQTEEQQKNSNRSYVDMRAQEWVKNLLEIQQSAGNSLDFLENVKIDLFPDVIYVFTPKGEIITLPRGATPVDFAYAVHTNIGHSTTACRIDKKLVPLRTKLETGKTIHIIKGNETQPNPAWLNFVNTAKARSQIRHFMRHQKTGDAIKLGQKMLVKSLRNFNMSYNGLNDDMRDLLITALNISSWDVLLEELGTGNRMSPLVAKQIHDTLLGTDDMVPPKNTEQNTPLPISGTEGMMVHFANCCHPIPGDDIAGFISTEKGLVIHREGCHNIKSIKNQPEKCLEVHWEGTSEESYLTELQLEAKNQRGTLATIASEIAKMNTDIERVTSEDKDDTYSLMNFVINVRDRHHLAQVIRRLKQLSIVEKIQRL